MAASDMRAPACRTSTVQSTSSWHVRCTLPVPFRPLQQERLQATASDGIAYRPRYAKAELSLAIFEWACDVRKEGAPELKFHLPSAAPLTPSRHPRVVASVRIWVQLVSPCTVREVQ